MYMLLVLLLQILYAIGVLGLALYGFNALWLTWQQRRSKSGYASSVAEVRLPADSTKEEWPAVTIQLPTFNERYVAIRLIDACAQLSYPINRLQIQILDDSTDQTQTIVQKRTEYWQKQGLDIQVVQREDRQGYKAGALAHALSYATGEFVALFDADFKPHPDFLYRMIPPFLQAENRNVAFIQARWGHLNRTYSPLTQSQALALDGHFIIEQAARQGAGYPFGFNGSAGVWRRACLEDKDVGGWQSDTLCEDLDLSYRAQLAGWRPLYMNHVEVPAEIPPQLAAFKRQQFRWAKGSVQTLRKVGGAVWKSRRPLVARLAGIFHLGSYLIHPLLLLIFLTILPLILLDASPSGAWALLSLTSLGPPLLYGVAQRQLNPKTWLQHWSYLPILMLLGSGLSLNNSVAVFQGLFSQGGDFLRTPKFSVEDSTDLWQQSVYRLSLGPIFFGEVGLTIYALITASVAIRLGQWWSLPFILLYAASYGLMATVGFWQAYQAVAKPTPPPAYPLDVQS